jgi:hypothetical protein
VGGILEVNVTGSVTAVFGVTFAVFGLVCMAVAVIFKGPVTWVLSCNVRVNVRVPVSMLTGKLDAVTPVRVLVVPRFWKGLLSVKVPGVVVVAVVNR